MTWLSPERLMFTEYVGGGSAIAIMDVSRGAVERLWQGAERMTAGGHEANFSLATDGKTSAVVRSSFESPPEVWSGPIGGWSADTTGNSGRKPLWGRAESVEWSSEGWRVQGWLLHPRVERAGEKFPMVVDIHGGPSGAVTPVWPEETLLAALSSRGYFVLLPNPRGSYGQGEAFTAANVRDFGGGDLRDILAGVDAVIARFPVDGKRLGVTGWSYGGYMTMWTVTQTTRFRAAVAGAGIANWQSYYGQNSIDQWMIPFFGASVYDDPAVYEKSSPIKFIKQVKTPTLVVVGERDAECPAPQSMEFWHALQSLGVPTKLVIYAGEGHMFTSPENRKDLLKRSIDWFGDHLRD
jgi:dipeptidyl aminopeptidase/acylaminoacyl peptidase